MEGSIRPSTEGAEPRDWPEDEHKNESPGKAEKEVLLLPSIGIIKANLLREQVPGRKCQMLEWKERDGAFLGLGGMLGTERREGQKKRQSWDVPVWPHWL